jgi:hypothetical protein
MKRHNTWVRSEFMVPVETWINAKTDITFQKHVYVQQDATIYMLQDSF